MAIKILENGSGMDDYHRCLPRHRGLFYNGQWRDPIDGRPVTTYNPGTGEALGEVVHAGAADVDAAVKSSYEAFLSWRQVRPRERAELLREMGRIVSRHAEELATIDAANCGGPMKKMLADATRAAETIEFFAGLVTEMKGETIPMGPGVIDYTLREPLGVVGRIIPFNHPLSFAAKRAAAPLAAGCTIVIKPPHQSPLSALRLAELVGDLFPPGVFNILPGERECGAALASHPAVSKVALIGSVPTGRAVLRAGADTLKKATLELGGKNALMAFPDADTEKVAEYAVRGMNFTWCGQSCGSMSRVFLHESFHDQVLDAIVKRVNAMKPGLPTKRDTDMGCLISREQLEKVERYVASGKEEGARLVAGGYRPDDDPELKNGFYYRPTVFADVKPHMKIAQEEIFGPVMSVFKWSEESQLLHDVNNVDYGLTASIWTGDLATAHRVAAQVEAGYVWVNNTSTHFLGAPFGGYKQSGLGREECLQELLDYTQIKNVNITLKP